MYIEYKESLEEPDFLNTYLQRNSVKFNMNHYFTNTETNSSSSNEKTNTKLQNEPHQSKNEPLCKKLNFLDDEDVEMSLSKQTNQDSLESTKEKLFLIRRKSSNSVSLRNNKFDEDYVILKTLSIGEQGTVYLCFNPIDKKTYAVKQTTEFCTKNDYLNMVNFFQCVNINYSLLFSSFILNYVDFWIENESDFNDYKKKKCLYIVNNVCPNGNLVNYIERLKQFHFNFNEDFYWDIVFEMMCGVAFIHQINFIHFDIKPKNFLVDYHGNLKLIDFCLSRSQDAVDNNESIEGDSVYLSLELFQNNHVTYKTDIFSLGLSILEVLTGVNLPKNGSLWRKIRNECVPKEFYERILFGKEEFEGLIKVMTNCNPLMRRNIVDLLCDWENFPHLAKRYYMLRGGMYKNILNPLEWKEFSSELEIDYSKFENINESFFKRSNSTKFVN